MAPAKVTVLLFQKLIADHQLSKPEVGKLWPAGRIRLAGNFWLAVTPKSTTYTVSYGRSTAYNVKDVSANVSFIWKLSTMSPSVIGLYFWYSLSSTFLENAQISVWICHFFRPTVLFWLCKSTHLRFESNVIFESNVTNGICLLGVFCTLGSTFL